MFGCVWCVFVWCGVGGCGSEGVGRKEGGAGVIGRPGLVGTYHEGAREEGPLLQDARTALGRDLPHVRQVGHCTVRVGVRVGVGEQMVRVSRCDEEMGRGEGA